MEPLIPEKDLMSLAFIVCSAETENYWYLGIPFLGFKVYI